jgi:hypothetical protein
VQRREEGRRLERLVRSVAAGHRSRHECAGTSTCTISQSCSP